MPAKQNNIAPPQITIIANLPDSLKPKQTFLDSVRKPLIVPIPSKAGGSYTVSTSNGLEERKLMPSEVYTFIDTITNLPVAAEAQGSANFTTFTTDDGLSLDAISCATMDKWGNLWFGTMGGGVSHFNGTSFTNFSTGQGLANNNINCITQDKSGNLWFGTTGEAVSRFDGKSFTQFSTGQGLPNISVRAIKEDKAGNLWFGTFGGGVSRFNGKSFTNFSTEQGLAENRVFCIAEDKSGNLWFGTREGGVSRYNGKTFTNFSMGNGLTNNTVYCITEDKSGKLWFGTYGGGVSCYDGKTFTNFSTKNGLPDNTIICITEDKSGNLWFGTNGGGASRFDGQFFTNFSTKQGLANNYISSITEDASGNLWFGTKGGGICRYNGKSFMYFPADKAPLKNIVNSITEDKLGNLWLGTDGGGASCYSGSSFTNFNTSQGLISNLILSVKEDQSGNLWFGTNGGGASRYDGKSFTTFFKAQGLANNTINCIYQDKSGNLWFGNYGEGLSRYDGKSFTKFSSKQGLADNIINCITEDKFGNLWFGTENGGASRFDGKSFLNFSSRQGLANNSIICITTDKLGNLWFGTYGGGLSLISKDRLESLSNSIGIINMKIFENFTKADDELPDDGVTQIIANDDGTLFVGTNSGICELIPSASEKGWMVGRTYNSSTGYPVKDVNAQQNAMFKDSKGIIWIATGTDKIGLVRFDPKAVQINKNPPLLIIDNIKINNESICWMNLQTSHYSIKNIGSKQDFSNNSLFDSSGFLLAQFKAFGSTVKQEMLDAQLKKYGDIKFDSITKWYPLPVNLILPYTHNSITFNFLANETRANFLVRYQYKLEGEGKEWSTITDKTSATFGNLFEGTYTFLVKARSPEGVWCAPLTYTFKVLPPWWRTWWMYALYIALAVTLIGGYIKWRVRVLKNENAILEHKITFATKVIREEKEKSDALLLNILPFEVAEELKAKGSTTAKNFNEVTVLFTDFKDFTNMGEKLSAQELVNEINYYYSAFDKIITKYGIEKIKTIGDAYMCAGGLPVANTTNAEDTVRAALEIRDFVLDEKYKRELTGKPFFEIRIGCNTGAVVAGIVGIKKFAYDIWGDTVNIASRMESTGKTGKVNISSSTYELVKDKFTCTHRGRVEAKNKGMINMYFVENYSQKSISHNRIKLRNFTPASS